MLMVFLFDSANIALVGYRLRFRGTDGSANHFDTKSLVEHVTEESNPSVQSLRIPLVMVGILPRPAAFWLR
jgi:hypothetical protein